MDTSSPAKTGHTAESANPAFSARPNFFHAPVFDGPFEKTVAAMLGFSAWEIEGGAPPLNTKDNP